jgi:hypothetical protein
VECGVKVLGLGVRVYEKAGEDVQAQVWDPPACGCAVLRLGFRVSDSGSGSRIRDWGLGLGLRVSD